MTPRPDALRARAYLLGALDDRERDLVEDGYFASVDAIEIVEAAEEALIEDYLEHRLDVRERDQFDRHYLATPEHRIRVETIRSLARASRQQNPALHSRVSPRLLAIAATLAIVATASVWVAQRSDRPAPPSGETSARSGGPTREPAAPVTFAFSLSPSTVRGVAETPALVIPQGVDVIALRLESDGVAGVVARGRVVISRVTGEEVWRGALTSFAGTPLAGTLAAAAVPADRLRPDDYVVTLFETDASGTDTTRAQYFLRVR